MLNNWSLLDIVASNINVLLNTINMTKPGWPSSEIKEAE